MKLPEGRCKYEVLIERRQAALIFVGFSFPFPPKQNFDLHHVADLTTRKQTPKISKKKIIQKNEWTVYERKLNAETYQDVVDRDVDDLDEEADKAHDEKTNGGGVGDLLELCAQCKHMKSCQKRVNRNHGTLHNGIEYETFETRTKKNSDISHQL